MLQSVETHLGSHASEYGGSCIATDAFHLAHGSQALDANGIASLNLSIVIYLRLVLCIAQGSGSFFLIFFLLCLSLGMAFLALLYLGYLASYLVVSLLGVNLLYLLLEGIEFLADAAGLHPE